MTRDPATDPSPTLPHRHLAMVERPAPVVRHCGFQECHEVASWSCESGCPGAGHRPIYLCGHHADRKRSSERDQRGRCYEHQRMFSPAWQWEQL